jgi:hypothetical protein
MVLLFKNRFGEVPRPHTINQAIKRIVGSYNATEILEAKKKKENHLFYLTSRVTS